MLYEIKEFIIEKKYLLITLIMILLIIIGLTYIFLKKSSHEKKDEDIILVENIKKESPAKELKKIKVDIKGCINNSGLYEVEEDSRVMDVINMAGGLTDDADTSVINLGKKVFDEMVIYVYSKNDVKNFIQVKQEEKIKDDKCITNSYIKNDACITKEKRLENTVTITTTANENTENDINNKVNNTSKISINNASKEELMTLSGIGESKAIAIIKYREENGGFKTIEEIMNISGIGEKVFAKIKDSIEL